MTEAVILIPGIMGSVLKDGDDIVWPGSLYELLLPYGRMEQLMKQDLQAVDIVRSFSISKQYDELIESLGSCGFRENIDSPTLVVFPYDWRKDNALAARQLADCIDATVEKFGGNVEINLIAHSMGGLVARYYLESELYSDRPGFSGVKCLITIGTPHLGTPLALGAALGQEKRLFLSAEQVKRLCSQADFPSLYQLLPHQTQPFAWRRDAEARLTPLDIYTKDVAEALGLVGQNLAAASNFHSKLNLQRKPLHVRYFFFAGTQQETTTAVQISRTKSSASAHALVRENAGDGTVPTWSALQPGFQSEMIGGEHGELYKNGTLKKVMGVLLGRPAVLAAEGFMPEISVLHKVVEPEASTRVSIDFPPDTVLVSGEVRLRRRTDAGGTLVNADLPASSIRVSYSGAPIDHLAVLINAPEFAGAYDVFYLPDGHALPVASTELLVQQT